MKQTKETISEYKQARKINTTRTIFICISVISFALLILVVALPSMNEKNNEKAEKEALRRVINFSKNMDEDMAASLSAKKNTDNAELPEVILDDIRTKEIQNSAESKVIPRKDFTLSLVYTVQAGRFDTMPRARKLYDSIINDINSEDLAYLRIEKAGRHYVVRIGKFEERRYAEIFHERIRSQLSTAMIIQDYIKEYRIKKRHSS
jgi:hypothetical protein